MAWTTDKREHARRLAICAECPHAVMTVVGACDTCKRPRLVKSARSDDDMKCPRSKCQGEIKGHEEPRCGACGCPLRTRVYSSCPKGKW